MAFMTPPLNADRSTNFARNESSLERLFVTIATAIRSGAGLPDDTDLLFLKTEHLGDARADIVRFLCIRIYNHALVACIAAGYNRR